MGISYDPGLKRWNVVNEKTDYDQNRPIADVPQTIDLWAQYNTRTQYVKGNPNTSTGVVGFSTNPGQDQRIDANNYVSWKKLGTLNRNYTDDDIRNVLRTEPLLSSINYDQNAYLSDVKKGIAPGLKQIEKLELQNQYNQELNDKYKALNEENTAKNNAYNTTVAVANRTNGGDYVTQRDALRNIQGISQDVKDTLETYYKAFYRTEKLDRWDASLGAKPLYGDFDPKYYKEQNPELEQKWKQAVSNDDIDITDRYGENGYYLQHYTSQGKAAGLRGNAAEVTNQAKEYIEKKPTDQDIQDVRSLQLGIDTGTQTQRLLNIPGVASEWEKAKNNDPYWTKLAKEKFLDVSKKDEFAALFRLSNRPEDKQVAFSYNANLGYGITELEDAVNQAVGDQTSVDVKRFGALTQNVLKDTIEEMKKAKQKESTLSLMRGLSGFSEITNINKDLASSIFADSGVGGILSITGDNKSQESLEKSLQKITGVNNNATYNWQQWFDSELKKRYDQDLELGYTTGEAKNTIKVQADFARNFIDQYLVPRFNTSRSMDEFVEYLDVKQEEKNPFQTQDMLDAVKGVANLRSQKYLDELKQTNDRYFDSSFYFNPEGNKAREADYANQASTVAQDWQAAKDGDPYWAQQAYRFGIDVNDKDAFARIHYQVKGMGQGFDAAKDILTDGRVQDEIYNHILPALKEAALTQGTVFGQFIKPEEIADQMLKGLNPDDKTTWDTVLKKFGLSDFTGTIDDLRADIMNTFRTGSAQDIREQIKYLNEKREKPTQEKLGITYIERPEDYKDTQPKADTQLYKVFQSAGYQGTEDEFYEKFFPDTDRSEQTLLSQAGKNKKLEMKGLDLKDPYAALGSIEDLFGDGSKTTETTQKSKGFFDLGSDEEDTNYKTKTGQQILGEFTSMFKGF